MSDKDKKKKDQPNEEYLIEESDIARELFGPASSSSDESGKDSSSSSDESGKDFRDIAREYFADVDEDDREPKVLSDTMKLERSDELQAEIAELQAELNDEGLGGKVDYFLDEVAPGSMNFVLKPVVSVARPLINAVLTGNYVATGTVDEVLDVLEEKGIVSKRELGLAVQAFQEREGILGVSRITEGGQEVLSEVALSILENLKESDKLAVFNDLRDRVLARQFKEMSAITDPIRPGRQGGEGLFFKDILRDLDIVNKTTLSQLAPFLFTETGTGSFNANIEEAVALAKANGQSELAARGEAIIQTIAQRFSFKRGGFWDFGDADVAAFALDVGLDPLTYLSFGTAGGVKASTSQGVKYFSKKGLKEVGDEMRRFIHIDKSNIVLNKKGGKLSQAEELLLESLDEINVEQAERVARDVLKRNSDEPIALTDDVRKAIVREAKEDGISAVRHSELANTLGEKVRSLADEAVALKSNTDKTLLSAVGPDVELSVLGWGAKSIPVYQPIKRQTKEAAKFIKERIATLPSERASKLRIGVEKALDNLDKTKKSIFKDTKLAKQNIVGSQKELRRVEKDLNDTMGEIREEIEAKKYTDDAKIFTERLQKLQEVKQEIQRQRDNLRNLMSHTKDLPRITTHVKEGFDKYLRGGWRVYHADDIAAKQHPVLIEAIAQKVGYDKASASKLKQKVEDYINIDPQSGIKIETIVGVDELDRNLIGQRQFFKGSIKDRTLDRNTFRNYILGSGKEVANSDVILDIAQKILKEVDLSKVSDDFGLAKEIQRYARELDQLATKDLPTLANKLNNKNLSFKSYDSLYWNYRTALGEYMPHNYEEFTEIFRKNQMMEYNERLPFANDFYIHTPNKAQVDSVAALRESESVAMRAAEAADKLFVNRPKKVLSLTVKEAKKISTQVAYRWGQMAQWFRGKFTKLHHNDPLFRRLYDQASFKIAYQVRKNIEEVDEIFGGINFNPRTGEGLKNREWFWRGMNDEIGPDELAFLKQERTQLYNAIIRAKAVRDRHIANLTKLGATKDTHALLGRKNTLDITQDGIWKVESNVPDNVIRDLGITYEVSRDEMIEIIRKVHAEGDVWTQRQITGGMLPSRFGDEAKLLPPQVVEIDGQIVITSWELASKVERMADDLVKKGILPKSLKLSVKANKSPSGQLLKAMNTAVTHEEWIRLQQTVVEKLAGDASSLTKAEINSLMHSELTPEMQLKISRQAYDFLYSVERKQLKAAGEEASTKTLKKFETAEDVAAEAELEDILQSMDKAEGVVERVTKKDWTDKQLRKVLEEDFVSDLERKEFVKQLLLSAESLEEHLRIIGEAARMDAIPKFRNLSSDTFFREPLQRVRVPSPHGIQEISIPRTMAKDLEAIPESILRSKEHSYFLKIWDSLTQGFKTFHTVVDPAFSFRNWYSNVMYHFLGYGINFWRSYPTAKQILSQANMDKVFYSETGQAFTYAEIRDGALRHKIISETAEEQGVRVVEGLREKVARAGTNQEIRNELFERFGDIKDFSVDKVMKYFPAPIPAKAGRQLSGGLENWERLSFFINEVRKGSSFSEAAANVNRFLVDYDNLGKWERMLKRGGVPFITWFRNMIPVITAETFKQPGKMALFHKMFEPTTEDDNRFMPSYKMDDGTLIRVNTWSGKTEVLGPIETPISVLRAFDGFIQGIHKGVSQSEGLGVVAALAFGTTQGFSELASEFFGPGPQAIVDSLIISEQGTALSTQRKLNGRTIHALVGDKEFKEWGTVEKDTLTGRTNYVLKDDKIINYARMFLLGRVLNNYDSFLERAEQDPVLGYAIVDGLIHFFTNPSELTGTRTRMLPTDIEQAEIHPDYLKQLYEIRRRINQIRIKENLAQPQTIVGPRNIVPENLR